MSDIKIIVNGDAELELAISVLEAAWAGGATSISLNRAAPTAVKMTVETPTKHHPAKSKWQTDKIKCLEDRIADALELINSERSNCILTAPIGSQIFTPADPLPLIDVLQDTLLGKAS